jgi:hypothetical protein
MTDLQLIEKFDQLTEFTYIIGMEDEVYEKYLPKTLTRDSYDNYFIKIGESKTMFTCHLDVVGKEKKQVMKEYFLKEGRRFVKSVGETVLGGDDKAGVVILLNMIEHNIPGLYYFFMGEEVATLGSKKVTKNKPELFKDYIRCVAFDRKSYGSIINRQMGKICCSNAFANSLADEFRKTGMEFKIDPFAVWTDSALFMGLIPECTNLSVGYFNEHKHIEEQDLDYMVELANAATKIDWESLKVERTPAPYDTPEPVIVKKPTDLPLKELYDSFYKFDDLMYDATHLFASNCNFFKPEKEMTYFGVNDINNEKCFSAWAHMDGSFTVKRGKITITITNIKAIEKMNLNKLKKIMKFKKNVDIKEQLEINSQQQEIIQNENLITNYVQYLINKDKIKNYKNEKLF